MEDVLEIVIKGDQMARAKLREIWQKRDEKESEFDENLKKQHQEKLAEAQKKLDDVISEEKLKADKEILDLEQETKVKLEKIKKVFAESEHEWTDFVVSETVKA